MILNGKDVAAAVIKGLRLESKPSGLLLVVQLGNDSVSEAYIWKKRELARELGVETKVLNLSDQSSQEDVLEVISRLNSDPAVAGYLVQIPLPVQIDRSVVARAIAPQKDIDGFHYLVQENSGFLPPTILAAEEILNFYGVEKSDKKMLIVGGGFLVGKPLYRFLKERGFSPDILEKDSDNYERLLKEADIVFIATGGGRRFTAADFKSGAVVIDASTISEGGKLRGDVSIEGWPADIDLAPVPGGVGPVTVAMLLKNFFKTAKYENRKSVAK